MQAVISGQAGVALLLEDQGLRSLHAGTAEIIQRREREIPYLLGDATDLQFLEDVEIPEISRQLEIATAQADALHLALILLDPELPQDVRCDAANELAELFALEDVREYVENLLFAHPLPSEADLQGALSCCSAQSVAAFGLLVSLEGFQSEILEVFTAWERIPTPVFGEEKARASALATAVREGLFRDLVFCRAAHASVDQFLAEALSRSKMRQRKEILLEWVTPLRNAEPVITLATQQILPDRLHGTQGTPVRTPDRVWDAFLCYHRQDHQFAAYLGRELEKSGIKIWLDEFDLEPGRPWQEAIEEVLREARALIVCIGPSGLGAYQEFELQMASSLARKGGLKVIPVILPEGDDSRLPVSLRQFKYVDFRHPETTPLQHLVKGFPRHARRTRH